VRKRDGPFTVTPGSYDRCFTEFSLTNSRKSARDYGSTSPFATIPNASSNLGWRRLHLNCSQ
jgi:hypothetical protein